MRNSCGPWFEVSDNILMATSKPTERYPLYTKPNPPRPRSLEKLLVAILISSNVNSFATLVALISSSFLTLPVDKNGAILAFVEMDFAGIIEDLL